jgi:hypothetical protein
MVLGLLASSVLGCAEDPAPDKPALGGAGGTAGASGNGGANSSSAGKGGVSTAGSGGGGATNAGSGGAASGACALQGAFKANADLMLSENNCNTVSFKTIYNITIEQESITLEQYVEKFPMTGTIDAACHAEIIVEAPTYREFQLTFAPASLTASGTHIEANSSDCRSTYQATLELTAQ